MVHRTIDQQPLTKQKENSNSFMVPTRQGYVSNGCEVDVLQTCSSLFETLKASVATMKYEPLYFLINLMETNPVGKAAYK
uniref:Uncharacterized protein n=1 Tax=Romanomermis culicivorax TaxID=13658 RepID=A0A915J4E8_ROMCU